MIFNYLTRPGHLKMMHLPCSRQNLRIFHHVLKNWNRFLNLALSKVDNINLVTAFLCKNAVLLSIVDDLSPCHDLSPDLPLYCPANTIHCSLSM